MYCRMRCCAATVWRTGLRAREAENGATDLRAERRRALAERLTLGCYYTAQAALALSVVVAHAA